MSAILVKGWGAVSPAGWGTTALRSALANGEPLTVSDLPRPGWPISLRVRRVPAATPRPAFMSHARLRRTSPITQFAAAAALEAVGDDAVKVAQGTLKLGVILCVMSGCVNYSRRFYDETLRDPATASPLVFPETVFNAPASHIASLLGTTAINYTLVGDPGTYLQGLELATDWLADGLVNGCVVIGAEETDWLTADAYHLFSRPAVLSEGAGALYLTHGKAAAGDLELRRICEAFLFHQGQPRGIAAQQMRAQFADGAPSELLCDGRMGIASLDAAEAGAWLDWSGARSSPKTILGEGLMAAAAWQCVTAVDALGQNRYTAADVSVVGCNQQAIGARFELSR